MNIFFVKVKQGYYCMF